MLRSLKILFRRKEAYALGLSCAYKSEQCGKYLALKILDTSDSGAISIIRAFLAKRARLKALKSLNPIYPTFFGLHIFSQLIHAIGFSFSRFCKKFRVAAKIESIKESWSRYMNIWYTSIACNTALIRTSQSACDKNFFPACHFFKYFNFNIPKNMFFDNPIMHGIPTYFLDISSTFFIFMMPLISLLTRFRTSLAYIVTNFWSFIICPDNFSYLMRIFF